MTEEIKIPDRHIDFCKAIARLCKEHEVNNFTATYDPGFGDSWRDKISMSWTQGRHGEDNNKIHINSSKHVHARIEP